MRAESVAENSSLTFRRVVDGALSDAEAMESPPRDKSHTKRGGSCKSGMGKHARDVEYADSGHRPGKGPHDGLTVGAHPADYASHEGGRPW